MQFKFECSNCRKMVEQGPPSELIHAMWEDGAVDQHNACSTCVVLIKAHNEKIEAYLAAQKAAPPVRAVEMVAEAKRETEAPAAPPQPDALSLIAQSLQAISAGQDKILAALQPKAPDDDKPAKRPARRR